VRERERKGLRYRRRPREKQLPSSGREREREKGSCLVLASPAPSAAKQILERAFLGEQREVLQSNGRCFLFIALYANASNQPHIQVGKGINQSPKHGLAHQEPVKLFWISLQWILSICSQRNLKHYTHKLLEINVRINFLTF
jgi:hypothetical protein